MNKLLLGVLFLLITTQFVDAAQQAENTITYTIIEDSAIVEHKINFSEEQLRFKLNIPLDSEAIELEGASFNITESEVSKIISTGKTKEMYIKYISDSFIEKTKDRYFTVNLAAISGEKDITVILPESASLKYSLDSPKSSLIPSTKDITSDGKRIIINWGEDKLSNANSLLVIYTEPAKKGNLWITFVLIGVVLIVFGSVNYIILRKKQKNPSVNGTKADTTDKVVSTEHYKDLTRNLFEEEKSIVEILLKAKNNEMWQKQLLFETGISKVRLSRKLRALEYKGIIEKIPFGNTNKIRLKLR